MRGIPVFFPRRSIMAIVAGLVGAGMLTSGYFLTEGIWKPLVGFNSFLSLVQVTQALLLGLLILVLTGSLAVSWSGSLSGTMKESLSAGLIAGSTAGVIVAAIMLIAGGGPAGIPVVLILRLILLSVIITIPGSVLGSFAYHRGHSTATTEADTRKQENQLTYTLPALLVLILICLVIPSVLALAGTMTGLIHNDCTQCHYLQDARAERQEDGSLLITYTAKNSATPWVGHYTPARILIRGADVSNQTAIQMSGLPLTITPSAGLSYSGESSVLISGPGISGSRGNPVIVTIISYFGSGEPTVLYNEST